MTGKPHSIVTIAAALMALSGCVTGPEGEDRRPSDRSGHERPSGIGAERVASLVERALPQWDDSVMAVQDGKNWTEHVDIARVFAAMGDEAPPLRELPSGLTEISDHDRTVRLVPQQGKVRYLNRGRAWNPSHRDSKAVDEQRAVSVARQVVGHLGIPEEEMSKPNITTQMAAGAKAGARQVQDRFEMARIVTLSRQIGKLPVYNSRVTAAVSNQGELERFQAVWPAFRLKRDVRILERRAVVDAITDRIVAQEPDGDVKIQAYLAYAPTSPDDEDITYVPALIVSVYAKPTPYQLVVPVAGGAATVPRGEETPDISKPSLRPRPEAQ
jgi:hypothetical protein